MDEVVQLPDSSEGNKQLIITIDRTIHIIHNDILYIYHGRVL
jgi:hypothetical protein